MGKMKTRKAYGEKEGETIMKANIEGIRSDGKVGQNRKENGFIKQYAIYDLSKDIGEYQREKICLRIYATDARHYACIWIHNKKHYGSGGGHAGGYGYHKGSAAAQAAIQDAGIKLSEGIGGRGDAAIKDALRAIADAINITEYFIGEAHA